MNYYEHHLGDYLRATAHLSILEDGAYRRLLDAYYTRERPLPPDLKECCKLARATSRQEREAVGYVLKEFFRLEADGYHQTRADEEIGRFHEKQAKARGSANARWGNRKEASERNANASADAMRSHAERICETDANDMLPSPQSPDTRQNPPLREGSSRARARGGDPGNGEGNPETGDPEALQAWSEHRRLKGKPLQPHETAALGELLAGMGDAAIQRGVVRTAIANGWPSLKSTDAIGVSLAAVPDTAAQQAWTDLIASDGAKRGPREQRALDAIGGWLAVKARTPQTEPKLRAEFCRAWQEAA